MEVEKGIRSIHKQFFERDISNPGKGD